MPVFYEVSGVLDTRNLCAPSQLRQILDESTREGVQIQLKGEQFCIIGSLKQVIQFEENVRKTSQAIQVFGDIDGNALKFVNEVLDGKRKQESATVDKKRSLQNKQYNLIPFLLALAKNYRKISKKAKAVSIYRKEPKDEDKQGTIRIGFQGAKSETDELIAYIQGFYEREDERQDYVLTKVAGSPTLKGFVINECLAKFNPTLLVLENDDIYVVASQTQCEKCEKWMEEVISSEKVEDDHQKEIQKVLLEYTVDGRSKEQNHGVDEDSENNHHTLVHRLLVDPDVTKNTKQSSKEKVDPRAFVRNRKNSETDESMGSQNHAEDASFEGDHHNRTCGFDENTAVTQQGTTELFKEKYVSNKTHRPGSSVANRTKPTQSEKDENPRRQYHEDDQSSEGEDSFDETTAVTKSVKESCKEDVKKSAHSAESSTINRMNSFNRETDKSSEQENYAGDQGKQSAGSNALRDNSEEDMDYGQHDDESHGKLRTFALDPNTVQYIDTFCKETIEQLEGKYHVKFDFSRKSEGTIVLKDQFENHISEEIYWTIGGQMQDIHNNLRMEEIDTRGNVHEHIKDITDICGRYEVIFDKLSGETLRLIGNKEVIWKVSQKIEGLVGKKPRERVLMRSSSQKSPTSPADHLPMAQNFSATVKPRSHHAMPQALAYQHKKTKVVIHTQLGDITKVTVDAIVNAANKELQHYGGKILVIMH